ncbi:hypothetical protein E8E13_006067 [Curvularia kusanoi]|uniref:Uncharacterized protein n=1 Tax=Curvularia kusanoi TaxID=90978 RepID=A0A9P4WEW6_CURKU|nr:hypothetical protein E8E13_006067 [Curvularia kusanoi]
MHFLTAAALLTSALLARAQESSPDTPSPYYNATTTAGDISTTPSSTPSASPDPPSTTADPAPAATSPPISAPTFATSFLWPQPTPDNPGTGSPLTPIQSPSPDAPSTMVEPSPPTTFVPSTLATSLLLSDASPTPNSTPGPIVVETRSIPTVFITVTVTVTPTPLPTAPLDSSTQPAGSFPELPSSPCHDDEDDDDDEYSAIPTPLSPTLLPPSFPLPLAPTLPLLSQPASWLAATSSPTGVDSSDAATTTTTPTATTPTTTGKRIWPLPHFTLDTAALLSATPTIGSGPGETPVSVVLETGVAVEGGVSLGADRRIGASAATATAAIGVGAGVGVGVTALSLASGPLGLSGQGQPSFALLATKHDAAQAQSRAAGSE